jgi:uncharacterized protein (TIGR03000 family)
MPPVPPTKTDGTGTKTDGKTTKPKTKEPTEESEVPPAAQEPNRTSLRVTLPADARLTINGASTQSTGPSRQFITPVLRPNMEYFYLLRIEYMQDQQPMVQTRRVAFRPGQEIQVNFEPAAQVAAER